MNRGRAAVMFVAVAIASIAMTGASRAAEAAPRQMSRPSPMTRATADEQRRALDDGYPKLTAVIDRWTGLPHQPRDFRKTTAAADLRNYVLPAEVRERIAATRREADRQYAEQDWPGAILYYNETFGTADAVARRLRAVHAYWFFTATWEAKRSKWARAVRAHDFEDPHAAQLASLERLLRERVLQGDFIAAQGEAIEPINTLFEQSVRMLRARSGLPVLDHDPLRQAPKARCVARAAADASGTELEPSQRPKVDGQRSRSPDGFYPRDAVLFGMIGNASVRVMVAESGCAAWAEIADSSGHWRLDEAAIDYALRGAAYFPGRVGGQPVDTALTYNVRFKIGRP